MEGFKTCNKISVEFVFIVVIEATKLENIFMEIPACTKYGSQCFKNSPTITPYYSDKKVLNLCSKSWQLSRSNWNKLMHILMGNRRLGYNIASWNCRKGLLLPNNSPSEKLTDVESLLQRHDLHLLAVIESYLHGVGSRVKRVNPISTKEIMENLHVKGFSIKLPRY